MLKNQYYQPRRHCRYFSLSCSLEQRSDGANRFDFCIVASKKGVHKYAVKRNFAKRRLRVALRNFLKSDAWLLKMDPALKSQDDTVKSQNDTIKCQSNAVAQQTFRIKIFAHKEILVCSFTDLNTMFQKSLNTYLP